MFDRRRWAFLKPWLIPLGIFVLALAVRVPGLASFNTVDESLWAARTQAFVAGLLFPDYACPPVDSGRRFPTTGLGCTLQTGHPGVTTMWGGGLGLLAYYWQAVRPTGVTLRTFLISSGPLHLPVLAAMRLPLAVTAALFVLLFYWLVRRLLGEKVAFLAGLLVALSPFHIALSRVLHHDALTANFMVLSLLPMAGYWLQGWKRRWLVVSAIFAGAAFLSKAVGWFLMPCAAMVGLLSLYYHWRQGEWRGWASVGQVVGEGVVWGAVAWLTFAALFPAMWAIPGEVIRTLTTLSFRMAEQGHDEDQFFLGAISRNPGPLFYPVSWLLEASPLEVLGLLALPAAAWSALRSLRQATAQRSTRVALALFVVTFLAFETLSAKKGVRYFLPDFPIIDIFVAIGLLWLAEQLVGAAFRISGPLPISSSASGPGEVEPAGRASRWALPAIVGLILLGQGWLVADNYPYYFTYYNPLLGGAPGAAQIVDVGWGEGLSEVAAFLNQQPESASLEVTSDYASTLQPFLAGQAFGFNNPALDPMQGDYLVFYHRHLQSELHDPNLWRYFDEHAMPAYRVTLHGLDYAMVYRNPIEQRVCAQDDRKGQKLALFGYNLAPDGSLILFWQNLKVGNQLRALHAGLAPAAGGETRSQRDPERWVACAPAPAFAEDSGQGAIVESQCPLATSGAPPGRYDLRLGLGSDQVSPLVFPAGEMAVLVGADQRFSPIAPPDALAQSLKDGLVKPVNFAFGNTLSLAGYRLEPAAWQAGGDGALDLYWQPQRQLSLALVTQFRLSLGVLPPGATEPVLTVPRPFFPRCLAARDLTPAGVLQTRFRLSLPDNLPLGAYTLRVCLTVSKQSSDCLPLPVSVVR